MRPNATLLPRPQSARKWRKIDIFLAIIRKQSNFYHQKFCLYCLLSHKQANSDYFFRNLGTSLKFGHFQGPLSGLTIDDFPTFSRFFYKIGCVGRHPIISHCGAGLMPRAGCAPGDAGQRRALFSAMRLLLSDIRSWLKQDAVEAMLLLRTNMI